MIRKLPWRLITVVVVALVIGNILRPFGRGAPSDAASLRLAESLSWLVSVSSHGPITASAIHGAAVIIAAVLLPLIIIRVLR